MNFINRIKYWLRKKDYKKRFDNMCKINKKIILFGTPLHRNLGDQLITVATKKFLNDVCNEKVIYEIHEEFYRNYINNLEDCIKNDDIIIISGGGFIGNVWLGWLWLEDIIERFKNNKIIIFPQSVFFDKEKDNYIAGLERCRSVLTEHNDIVLYVREKYSLEYVKENFKNLDVRLVPDIALSYRAIILDKKKEKKVCFCLRNDYETNRDDNKVVAIKNFLKDIGCNIVFSDTGSKSRVYEFCRENFVLDKIREYSGYSLVVTDRLHGMIFSYLAGTPCIIFDNKSRKVYGVYEEWLSKSKLVIPFKNIADLNIIKKYINNALSNDIKDDFLFDMSLFNDIRDTISSK